MANSSPKEIQVVDYTDKSIVVTGRGTFDIKEQLKAAGGRWNAHLRVPYGKGWIFSKDQQVQIEEMVAKFRSTPSIVTASIPSTPKIASPILLSPSSSSSGSSTDSSWAISKLTPLTPPPNNVLSHHQSYTTGQDGDIKWQQTECTEIRMENGIKTEVKTIVQVRTKILLD